MEGLSNMTYQSGPVAILILTFVFAAAIAVLFLWIALPLAVFGVRAALRELVAGQRGANKELGEIRRCLETLAAQGEHREKQDSESPPKLTL